MDLGGARGEELGGVWLSEDLGSKFPGRYTSLCSLEGNADSLPWLVDKQKHSQLFFFFLSFCLFFFSFFVFCLFRATLTAYEGSQARGLIGAVAAGLRQSYMAELHGYVATGTTAHGNTGSLTHQVRPGIEPATSWFLVRFVSTAPRRELPRCFSFGSSPRI